MREQSADGGSALSMDQLVKMTEFDGLRSEFIGHLVRYAERLRHGERG